MNTEGHEVIRLRRCAIGLDWKNWNIGLSVHNSSLLGYTVLEFTVFPLKLYWRMTDN